MDATAAQQRPGFDWGRFWTAELIGWPVMIALLLVLLGGWNNLSTTLLISIVCTFGIGLVFWGLVAWLIGITILAAYHGITQRT